MAVRVYDSSWKDDLHLMQQLKEQHNSEGLYFFTNERVNSALIHVPLAH